MADIVTLAEAKAWLRVISNSEDDTLAMLITAASDAVGDLADLWDGTGEAPARLKLAVLTRVATSFDNRERTDASAGEPRLIGPMHTVTL